MLEKFEKMFEKNSFLFETKAEIAIFELHYPDVFKTDPEANRAARQCAEATLTEKRKMFSKVPRKMIDSMSLTQIDENLTEILSIEDWLSKHPAIIKMSDVIDTAHDGDLRKLAHAKKMLALSLRAIPGSIVFDESNNFIRKIAEIEQKLGAHPEI